MNLINYALEHQTKLLVSSTFLSSQGELVITFPSFTVLEYDPDFGVLVSTDSDGGDGGGNNLALVALVSIIVPLCCIITVVVLIIVAVLVYMRKKKLQRLLDQRGSTHVNFGPDTPRNGVHT